MSKRRMRRLCLENRQWQSGISGSTLSCRSFPAGAHGLRFCRVRGQGRVCRCQTCDRNSAGASHSRPTKTSRRASSKRRLCRSSHDFCIVGQSTAAKRCGGTSDSPRLAAALRAGASDHRACNATHGNFSEFAQHLCKLGKYRRASQWFGDRKRACLCTGAENRSRPEQRVFFTNACPTTQPRTDPGTSAAFCQ